MKRGQVTIFIVIGIVMLAIVIGLLAVLSSLQKTKAEGQPRLPVTFAEPVRAFVENCITDTTEEGIELLAQQGGYFQTKDPHELILGLPYYYYNTQDLSPTKETVEQELAAYLDQELPFCFKRFVDFSSQGLVIKTSPPSAQVQILPSKVRVRLDFPLSLQKGERQVNLDTFSVEINSRFGYLQEVARDLLREQANYPEMVCLSCLFRLGEERKVRLTLQDLKENEVVFQIQEDRKETGGSALIFQFVNRYKGVAEPTAASEPTDVLLPELLETISVAE